MRAFFYVMVIVYAPIVAIVITAATIAAIVTAATIVATAIVSDSIAMTVARWEKVHFFTEFRIFCIIEN